jgi:hypothetical protein
VVGTCWLASRANVNVQEQLGVPAAHLVTVDLPSFPAKECACCQRDEPATDALDLN